MQPLSADRLVRQPPELVYAFLAELENHWRLDDRHLRLERLNHDGRGGRIVISGPLGLRRAARVSLTDTEPPRRVTGSAAIGRRTEARVTWEIEPEEQGARVTLEALALSAGPIDRLLLASGGRWWLRRRFRSVLVQLASALEQQRAPRLPLAA